MRIYSFMQFSWMMYTKGSSFNICLFLQLIYLNLCTSTILQSNYYVRKVEEKVDIVANNGIISKTGTQDEATLLKYGRINNHRRFSGAKLSDNGETFASHQLGDADETSRINESVRNVNGSTKKDTTHSSLKRKRRKRDSSSHTQRSATTRNYFKQFGQRPSNASFGTMRKKHNNNRNKMFFFLNHTNHYRGGHKHRRPPGHHHHHRKNDGAYITSHDNSHPHQKAHNWSNSAVKEKEKDPIGNKVLNKTITKIDLFDYPTDNSFTVVSRTNSSNLVTSTQTPIIITSTPTPIPLIIPVTKPIKEWLKTDKDQDKRNDVWQSGKNVSRKVDEWSGENENKNNEESKISSNANVPKVENRMQPLLENPRPFVFKDSKVFVKHPKDIHKDAKKQRKDEEKIKSTTEKAQSLEILPYKFSDKPCSDKTDQEILEEVMLKSGQVKSVSKSTSHFVVLDNVEIVEQIEELLSEKDTSKAKKCKILETVVRNKDSKAFTLFDDFYKGLLEGRPESELNKELVGDNGVSVEDIQVDPIASSESNEMQQGRSLLGGGIMGRSLQGGGSIMGRSLQGGSMMGRSLQGGSMMGRSLGGGSINGRAKSSNNNERIKVRKMKVFEFGYDKDFQEVDSRVQMKQIKGDRRKPKGTTWWRKWNPLEDEYGDSPEDYNDYDYSTNAEWAKTFSKTKVGGATQMGRSLFPGGTTSWLTTTTTTEKPVDKPFMLQANNEIKTVASAANPFQPTKSASTKANNRHQQQPYAKSSVFVPKRSRDNGWSGKNQHEPGKSSKLSNTVQHQEPPGRSKVWTSFANSKHSDQSNKNDTPVPPKPRIKEWFG